MKFGYDGAELGELIENYRVSNGRIFVSFLDKENNYNIPFDEESEKKLINCMLNQAIERDKNTNLPENIRFKGETLGGTLLSAGFTFLFLTAIAASNNNDPNFSLYTFGGLSAVASVALGSVHRYENKRVEELKKYRLYLSIREKIQNISDLSLYSGIDLEEKQGCLNINTIDNYSLKEVETINNNLNRIESNSKASNPVLIKK